MYYLRTESDAIHEKLSRGEYDPREAEHRLAAFEDARRWLSTVAPTSHVAPHPVLAKLMVDERGSEVLGLVWFESDFEAHGFRLLDDAGEIGAFQHSLDDFTNDEKDELRSTLVRNSIVRLAGPTADERIQDGPSRSVLLQRRPKGPHLRVRLLSNGASAETAPIEVFVATTAADAAKPSK